MNMWEVLHSLPVWYQYSLVLIFGAIIGSFVDVFTMRFHTGASINGRSHCCSCGHQLSWYELLPVISYLVQRGRCAACRAYIPVRLLMMELGVAGLFLMTYNFSIGWLDLFLHLALFTSLLIITVYDLRHFIIPNALVVVVTALVLLELGLLTGNIVALLNLWPSLLAAVAAFSFYGGLWAISKGRWIGFGDAKLATPLSLLLGPWGTFSFVIFSFWVGAVISVLLLGMQRLVNRGQLRLSFITLPRTMKSEVPFAPFMIIAFGLVYVFGADVLTLLGGLFYV